MELNFEHRKLAYEPESEMFYSTPSKSKENENYTNIIVKDHSEILISKRKEFIQNYRKKQRLLTLIESNTKNNINNAKDYKEISIKDIKRDPDPISRIIMFKNYIYSNQSAINIQFVNDNIDIITEWFKDYKKYLFNYQNKNLSKQIVINRVIIYNILSLLFEPEKNPIMDEIDFDFLSDVNNFSFYYFNLTNPNDNNNITENIYLYLYILFLLNNLIVIYPDAELIKATIDIKNIIYLIYTKFFSFEENKNDLFYPNITTKKSSNEIKSDNKLKLDNKYELFEFTFLKLIESCINCLGLNDNDIDELLSFLLSLVYYYYKNNKIILLIYSLESLARVNRSYLLLSNDYFNNFLLTSLGEFFHNNNTNNNDLIFLKNKLVLELYLQRILRFLFSYNNDEKIMNKNIDLFLNKEIITLLKKSLYSFYNELILNKNNNKRGTTSPEIKIIIKIIKIFCVYFELVSVNDDSNNNSNIIYLNIKNKIAKFLCSILILKSEEIPISLCDMILNIFTHFIKLNDKNSKKICNLVLDLFNNIYTLKNLNLYKDDFYFVDLQRILITDKINIHRVLLPYLNLDTYPFLIENMLEFVKRTLFFCEQYDNYQNGKTCLFEKINKEYFDLNVFEEIENIECNSINLTIKNNSEKILEDYAREQNDDS